MKEKNRGSFEFRYYLGTLNPEELTKELKYARKIQKIGTLSAVALLPVIRNGRIGWTEYAWA